MGCPHAATRFAGSSKLSHNTGFTVHDMHLSFPSDVELSLVRRFIVCCQLVRYCILLYRDIGGSRTRPQLGSSGQLLFVRFCLLDTEVYQT